MSGAPDIAPLATAFARITALVGGAPDPGPTAPTRADVLARQFGLDTFERDVVVMAAWAELEPDAARVIATRQGDLQADAPTLGLALACLPGAHWQAFSAEAPLRRFGLVNLTQSDRTTASGLAMSEAVLHSLVGSPSLSPELAGLATRIDRTPPQTPTRQRLRDQIVSALRANTNAVLQLCGPDPAGKEVAAAAAAALLDRRLFALPATTLPTHAVEVAAFARAWTRDLRLTDGILILDTDGAAEARAVAGFAEALSGPLIINTPETVALPRRGSLRFDMGRARAEDQVPLWRAALGPLAERMNGTVARLAGHFPIAPEVMESVAQEVRTAPQSADLDAVAWAACRRRARPRMDDLAARIDGFAGWDDIVLPEMQMRALRSIAAQVRHRTQVYEDWGFGNAAGGRGLGVSALFSGPSGAGKTLAAEVLGTALELDVYRIDLSSVVSKWIGETEKNLRRVFDAADEGCAILLFDEADALFGKRSEIKDSHDRYANIEVSYLLQRLESYRGLAILTTNLRGNIDEAFLRRLRFVVDFEFPSAPERTEIWARAFPDGCPTDGLDTARLAQLNVVGGAIRNIAMNAAFIAADRAHPVGMRDVLAAARLEYTKAGRAMTDPELRGWPK